MGTCFGGSHTHTHTHTHTHARNVVEWLLDVPKKRVHLNNLGLAEIPSDGPVFFFSSFILFLLFFQIFFSPLKQTCIDVDISTKKVAPHCSRGRFAEVFFPLRKLAEGTLLICA